MGKTINRIPSSHLLISSLLSKPHDSTSALKALPGKVDIKRHSPGILDLSVMHQIVLDAELTKK